MPYSYHMQLVSAATNSGGDTLDTPEMASDALATELATLTLETIPAAMRTIRKMMRAEVEGDQNLTIPQLRALGFIERNRDVSLSDVAGHLGIPLSGASRLVDKLVADKLVTRATATVDRRKVILSLLPAGEDLRTRVRQRTLQRLDVMFQRLTPAELDAIASALPVLRGLFSNEPNEPNEASGETSATTGEPPPP
ncbi:MAG TPA: MarR family winged helix-turn-helix transcriptional regulator [Ktedonobacterales bacterium]|nr:MarR family winged helix-turn-helix transcriptional regulator [Ktedonobacterales bacterium]